MGVRYVIGAAVTAAILAPAVIAGTGPDHAGRSGHSRPGAEKIRASSEEVRPSSDSFSPPSSTAPRS